jgi:hypothetical protein
MPLILSIKYPKNPEIIPLFVIDDLPCKKVLEDVLQVISSKSGNPIDPRIQYGLRIRERVLDLNKSLHENGIKDEDVLEVINTSCV